MSKGAQSCCVGVRTIVSERPPHRSKDAVAPLRLTAPHREACVLYTPSNVEGRPKLLRGRPHGCVGKTSAPQQGRRRPSSFDRAPPGSVCAVHAIQCRRAPKVVAWASARLCRKDLRTAARTPSPLFV